MTALLIMYLVISLLFIILAIPLLQRRIPPNYWYGFRVPKTLNNPGIWYPANAYLGRWMVVTGVIGGVASIGFYGVPGLSVDAYALLCAAVITGSLLLMLIQSFRYLGTLNNENGE